MENPPVNPVSKVELPKAEQSVEHFSLSNQKKNIQEVFKLSPELKTIASDSLGLEDDKDIIVELGRSKENNLGKIQNINIYYKGEKIINSDEQDSSKLYLVTKEDGTSYVGDIFIPTELQGQGLGKKILQKVSDTLDTKIVPTYLSTGGFTSDNAKKMWEKIGNEILPNHEAEKLYAEYLKTVFPESKIQEVVYHGTNRKFDKFERKHGLDDLSGIEGVDDYYFTDNIKLAKFFAEKYKKVLYAIQKSYEGGNVDWYFKRQENAGDFSEFKESTKELWDSVYNEWQYILTEAHNGKKLDDILKESNIKYFENKQGFGFRFGKMLLPYYLMSDYESYKTYPDGNIVPAVLNLKKPYIKEGDRNSMDGILSEAGYKHKKEDTEIDGGIQQDTDEKNIVVFKPEQIHILGSENDIEGFKDFIKKAKLDNQEKFNRFIKKDEYFLTKSDMEALDTIKEKPSYEDEDSELKFIRGNHVFTGEVDDTSNFYQMKAEPDEHMVEAFSKKQVFVSQLASGLIPVAPIGVKDGKFYSKLVQHHEGFSKLSEKNTPLFALVEVVLFRDTDKPGSDRPNILGGVSFDFDYASFEKNDKPNYKRNLDYVLENMHLVEKKDISLMMRLVENFKQQITGEEGKIFLDRNASISGYKIIPTEQLQEVLLNRVEELESYLLNILSK